MTGTITANGGKTFITSGTSSGDVTVSSTGQFTINGGALTGTITANGGKTFITSGTSSGNVTVSSTGEFTINGGALTGTIIANGGETFITSGSATGDVSVAAAGQFTMNGGSLEGNLVNNGTVTARTGTVTGNVTNAATGTVTITGHVSEDTVTQGTLTVEEGTFTNNNIVSFGEKGGFDGSLSNNARIQVSGNAQFHGTLTNAAAGTLSVDQEKTLTFSSGSIINNGKLAGGGAVALQNGAVNSGFSVIDGAVSVQNSAVSGNVTVAAGSSFSITGGSLAGDIDNQGTFASTNGAMTGIVTVAADSSFSMIGGSLEGDIDNQGTFASTNGAMTGTVTVAADSSFSMTGGSLEGGIDNHGIVVATNGAMTGTVTVAAGSSFSITGGSLDGGIDNHGIVVATNGTMAGTLRNFSDGQITMNGSSWTGNPSNAATFTVTENSQIHGTLTNESTGTVSVNRDKELTISSGRLENSGILTGSGTIGGTVLNKENGSVKSTLTIGRLDLSGGSLVLEESNGRPVALNVGTLNVTGGKFVMSPDGKPLQHGETYTIIQYGNLEDFRNFSVDGKLSDYVIATPEVDRANNRIQAVIEYLPVSDEILTNTFTEDEQKVVKAINQACIKYNQESLNRFYFYTPQEMKKQVETLRTKVLPVQNEQLPLTNVMASQVHAHLFANSMVENAADVWRPVGHGYYYGRSGGNASRNRKIWGQYLGGIYKEDKNVSLNRDELTTKSVGAMFGYDYEFSEKFLLGLLGGVSSAKTSEGKNQTNMRDYRFGLYTASRFGQVTLNTVLTGGFQKYESERHLDMFGMHEISKANYNGYTAEFDLNLGVDFMRVPYRDYSFFLRSYVSASVNYLYQNAYKEKGDAVLALGVNKLDNTSVSVSPGLTLGYNFFLFSETVLTADFSYQRLVSGEKTNASAYFLADVEKTSFPMASVDTDKGFFNAGVGLKMKLDRAWQLHLWAGSRTSRRTEALNFAATLSYSF